MLLNIQLDAIEARMFGVLIEKSLTTPDQYPLSINAATNGANQKSNRDPVLALEEDIAGGALQRLEKKYLARTVFLSNSRVEKYCHNGKDALALSSAELAIIAELLLRGPQTPGDLRARVSRMIAIDSLDHLMQLLGPLIEKGFIQRLPPGSGSRAERYVQLLSPDLHPLDAPATAAEAHVPALPGLAQRVETLEAEVARLRRQLELLAEKLGVSLAEDAAHE